MENMYIYFVRHAESKANQQKVYQGWSDVPLSETGKKQALALKNYLLHENIVFSKIYSSPMNRAMETALVLQPCTSKKIIQIDEFKSINVGKWQGKPIAAIKHQFKREHWNWRNNPANFRFPNGESLEDVLKRAKSAFLTIILDQNWENGKNVAIVSHMIVIKVLLVWLLKENLNKIWDPDFQTPNAGLIAFKVVRSQQQRENKFEFSRIPIDTQHTFWASDC